VASVCDNRSTHLGKLALCNTLAALGQSQMRGMRKLNDEQLHGKAGDGLQ
jgi:hypothetical protein